MRNLGNIKIITGAELAVVLADNTQLTIDSEHISLNGIVLDDSTSVDGKFTIGAAVTGQLTITILNEDELYSPYNFRDATCQLTLLGVDEIPDDEEEMQEDSIIIGQYNIVDYTYDGSDITLTAYDNLCKFDLPCTETRSETVTFPIMISDLVVKAATICQTTLRNQSNPLPNGSYTIAQQPEGWDSMTWHDVISYCAQLGGVYAKADYQGRIYFDWYNINAMPQGYDGGTFDTTTTPYSDGDTLNGGDFSYGSADSADGGTFTYPADMHLIDSPYSLTIDTDDVYITGLKVILEVANNINADENTQDYTTALYGRNGYVITISGNPFIQTTAQADSIKNFLGAVAVGMWFRPLNATIDDDLSIESGDQAYINGVNGDTYQCFISHVTYTTNAGTVIACDAEPNSSSEKTRFTAADKLASHVAKIQKKVERVSNIAGNTNQYFWHTQTGTDTGAHITEVPQEEFIDDPATAGGNLLIRSNGLAIRDGLNEMASFSATAMNIGLPNRFRMNIQADSISMMDPANKTGFNIGMTGNTALSPVTVSTYADKRHYGGFIAEITTSSVLLRATFSDGTQSDYLTITDSSCPINYAFTMSSTSSGGMVMIQRLNERTFEITIPNTSTTNSCMVQVSYKETIDVAKINFSGGNNKLWEGGYYMAAGQTAVLSELVSQQLSGIVLAWSAYVNGTVYDANWEYNFIPKNHVYWKEGNSVLCGPFATGPLDRIGNKMVDVYDNRIEGYSYNTSHGTASGITYDNRYWVLRYVLGV